MAQNYKSEDEKKFNFSSIR